MTSDPPLANDHGPVNAEGPAAPPPPDGPGVGRRPGPGRRGWWLLALVGALLLTLVFLPALVGGAVLARFGASAGLTADRVSGPLWAPHLSGVTLNAPGVKGEAGTLSVSVAGVNPITRTLRLNVQATDATVALKLKDLIGGPGGSGGGTGWKVTLGSVAVRNTRVNVDGTGVNVPDGRFSVTPGRAGRLAVRGATPDGDLNADVTLGEKNGANVFTMDLNADARVLNHYWPGVTAGRITGRYVLGDGPVRGDLRVQDGALRVPEAKFVTVTGVTGTATHRGDNVRLQLTGRGWNGPVTARGNVDLKAQNWQVTADAAPTVSGLARALGTTGQGDLKLRVTAGGWSTVRVKAYAQGAGTLGGVGVSNANVEYTYLNRDGAVAGQTNDLAFSADTALGGAVQKLAGRWAIGRGGRATLAGTFGQKALDVAASIDAQSVVRFTGQGLGGPLRGSYALSGSRLDAVLNPTYGAARARVALSGTAEDLRARVTGGEAGPFALAGTAVLDRRGLRADLGRARLNLDRSFKGTWEARTLQGAGVTLSGQGRVDLIGGDVTGTLSAAVPGLRDTLSGTLNLNYTRQSGTFTAGAQQLSWSGDAFGVRARNLPVSGDLSVTGDVTVTTGLKVFGSLRAAGRGVVLSAEGNGITAQLRGVSNGVTVRADTDLRAPYRVSARVQGADIRGELSMNQGVQFTLNTAGATARGVVNGQSVKAAGRVNLGALRPLLPTLGLGGTLDLNLTGRGGTADVNARVAGAAVRGTLTRQPGAGTPVTAKLQVASGDVQARVSGQVFPDVRAAGQVQVQGQTLALTVSGPYGALSAAATGRTGPLSFGGVTLPAQTVNLRGTVTPALSATGTWGELSVAYDGPSGLVRVRGAQTLTAFGQAGRVQGRATWGPGRGGAFRGAVDARGVLDQYTVALQGPWNKLNLLVTDAEGLRAQGAAALPSGRYDVDVSGPLGGGLFVDGNVQGTGLEPRGEITVRDRQGGRARVTLAGFDNLNVQASGLTLAGQRLQGTLNARGGVLNGTLNAGPFLIRAENGALRVAGTVAGQAVTASGRLTLPATLENLNLQVAGPYFTAVAGGSVANLRGTLRLNAQAFGSGPARLSVPAQVFPLSGSLTGARITVGGLTYLGGTWSGAQGLRYALGGRAGTVQLAGQGTSALLALPAGPLTGRVSVLPALGGTLSTALSPFAASLPEAVRTQLIPGQLNAALGPDSVTLFTSGTRYLGDPVRLDARAAWGTTLRVQGTLTHPGSRVPVAYSAAGLTVRGAVLDARVLEPVVPGVRGRVSLNLNVPELNASRASGRADVNVRAAGQAAQGQVSLARGQLSARLRSTLGGAALSVRGTLYPQANAAVTFDDLRATLTGRAGPTTRDTLTLRVAGTYARQPVNVTVTGTALTGGSAGITADGSAAGAALNVGLTQGRGVGLPAWAVRGSASAADLRPLLGSPGRATATLAGTLADVRASVSGEVAGVNFRAPARYVSGTLRLDGAQATLAQGAVRASGTVLPNLNLSAKATLTDLLPGSYTAQLRGALSKPDVTFQGVLASGPAGLRATGSRVMGRLLARDYRVTFSGAPLAGEVRGRLGANALGGLQRAALTLNTAYVSGDTDLRLRGPVGWNARTGFTGALRVVGDVPGGPLDALLDGQSGTLNVAAVLGTGVREARITGRLPASLPFRPGGTLSLAAFDVGALWGRPEQLRVTGTATLGGPGWAALNAAFAGQLQDSGGELGGALNARYAAGDIRVNLSGPRVSADGRLQGGRYALALRADPLRAARLLPATLDVDALTVGGTLDAAGTLAGGLDRLEVRNLAVKGQQEQAGPFSLYGTLGYLPAGDVLSADLSGSLRDGVLSARGALPGGLRVTARNLSTQYLNAASLGQGTLGADVTLTGRAADPALAGRVTLLTTQVDAAAAVSGRASDPALNARVSLRGPARGTLYVEASNLNLAAGTVQARLYGAVTSGTTRADVDLRGVWPRLSGQVRATAGLTGPVLVTGNGQGGYTLRAGPLGQGTLTLTPGTNLIPTLGGTLRVTPLPLAGGSGVANVQATLGGTLLSPTLAGTLTTRGASLGGVTLEDLSGSLTGTLAGLSGTFTQGGRTVAALKSQGVTLDRLGARAASSTLEVSGTANLNGTAALTIDAQGTLAGRMQATYGARALTLRGNLSGPQGLRGALDLTADQLGGWRGTARVTGGPAGLLTRPAALSVSGPFGAPLVQGEAGLLGAGARIVATARGVQLRLVDGPQAQGSGVLEARPGAGGTWRLLGAASLTRPEGSLSVTPGGTLDDPQAQLSVRRGEWRASGTVGLRAADLNVSDGLVDGRLRWQAGQLAANLPGLNLGRLGISGLSGLLTANGTLNTGSQDGRVTFEARELDTPYEVPALGVALKGAVTGAVTLRAGRPSVQATVTLSAGTLTLNAQQSPETWTGQLTGRLVRESGALSVDIRAGADGLTGTLGAARYPLDLAGQVLTLDGTVTLAGQTFRADLRGGNNMGAATVTASGGIADLLPVLDGPLAVQATGEGYTARATLDDLDIRDLKVAPALAGRISGEATLRDGGGTFVLRSANLSVGPRTLPARLEGTQVGGDWRIRGFLGESDFTAGLSGGEVFGQGALRGLPVGALVAAFTGAAPGEGVVTGVVRFRFPMADPPAGTVNVVAERIRVSATSGEGAAAVTETLTGSGTLEFAARELRSVNIQLSGAGTWDVRGQYTRERVDLNARFTNTTFTPVLQLVPGLLDLQPSLKGTLVLSAAGTYDRPRGLLRAENLQGAMAGLSLRVPQFAGDLPDSGAFTAGGRVMTGGTVGTDGTVNLRGQLTLGRLSDTRATFTGLLAPQALGALPNTAVTVSQQPDGRWLVDAQSRSVSASSGAGSLVLSGTLSPRWDLSLSARNYNLPLAVIYGRESALNADLRAVDDGSVIRVTGAADFVRLVLGRVNAPATIPAPGQSSTDPGTGRTTDNYVSPLPEQFTTFPQPEQQAGERPARPFLQRLVFEDIPITATNGIRIDENLVRAEFTGNLVLAGSGDRPRLAGSVRSQRGFVYLRENEFTLQTSTVTFSGDNLFPKFEVRANGTVQAATTRQRVPVTLELGGEFVTRPDGTTALELDTTLRCTTEGASCADPSTGLPYGEAELYALVATGVPNLATLPSNLAALGSSALQTALNVFVLGELERTIATAFGLDVFRLTPQLSVKDGTLGATITLGSYLTRDLYLQYQVNLNGEGLLNAEYSTPDNRFTFRVTTPLKGLNLQSIRPTFSAGYNVNERTNVNFGVENGERGVVLRFGIRYLFGR
ncbi:translocation/assembly module TamB domain-containing protein [Deinococcus taeanensis]|uniref:translocation/assembly module TamB domain-containing protein n=1 Tax=Deinococcus taeanensis TaxID=2737050 RepID=UPI001CDD5424|nr:translocation/assembly module TamB domain-containing protein [Deinococcus taeanensis]UBV41617.1 translocation/assembly module TamB domain-containing protein [Deinococcus taeanensis]